VNLLVGISLFSFFPVTLAVPDSSCAGLLGFCGVGIWCQEGKRVVPGRLPSVVGGSILMVSNVYFSIGEGLHFVDLKVFTSPLHSLDLAQSDSDVI